MAPRVGIEPTAKGLHLTLTFPQGMDYIIAIAFALGVLVSSLYGALQSVDRSSHGVRISTSWWT
jgi:hypothetical protein